MNLLVKLLLLAVLVGFSMARAQEIETGTGVVCDTSEQLKQVILDPLKDVNQAIEHVNNGTNACGLITVVYIRNEKVGEVKVSSGIYDLTEITILGAYTGQWRVVSAIKQFTAFFRPGQEL